ncbi:hypothetical protein OGATHE_003363 [Ogataea polymorpha]|uniref:Uncharacterized protein n=1 Tax=Ogataea polymorpha TaxID=460523 RepID=A0A9P8T356_9ASCO|nr:hypothetical protein OGATHE_003363 [Ogataea polymorpha]
MSFAVRELAENLLFTPTDMSNSGDEFSGTTSTFPIFCGGPFWRVDEARERVLIEEFSLVLLGELRAATLSTSGPFAVSSPSGIELTGLCDKLPDLLRDTEFDGDARPAALFPGDCTCSLPCSDPDLDLFVWAWESGKLLCLSEFRGLVGNSASLCSELLLLPEFDPPRAFAGDPFN